MNATMTIVMCLAATPDTCELREVRVDAQACFYGGRNVADAHTPEGYTLRSARCVPEMRRAVAATVRGRT